MRKISLLLIVLALLVACKEKKTSLPKSSGKPCEICIAGAPDSSLYRVLSARIETFPQPESSFDVTVIDEKNLNDQMKRSRNLIIVGIGDSRQGGTSYKQVRNKYADSQLVVDIQAPSKAAFDRLVQQEGGEIRALFQAHEIALWQEELRKNRHHAAEKLAGNMFGVSVLIPSAMQSHKRGRRFVWFSNDSPVMMQNICIYDVDGINGNLIAIRDSVMKENIKGETDEMYMRTAGNRTVITPLTDKGGRLFIMRGLWEMRNDAMGGPFFSRVLVDSANNRTVFAEAFVYAPGRKKRNMMGQLEASLYSLTINKQNNVAKQLKQQIYGKR